MKDKFFTKLDWAAFWTATIITMAVYFFTLGPSVGLEDSGELATAAANFGVPHPPGYPFWTFCCWVFCKVFSFVTYMGHPTPAWAVSLCSATFGAFAAGFTAMLICRSAHDFTECNKSLCFGGAVGGALTFAFSPVEWSQATIVEVYSLNAFFLMWVFLLSYRWMRKPSDKILWMTAFVFGLGLTNYQVLLFAIVPLAIIIAVKNLGLFRDIFIYLIPVGLTYQLLKVGCLLRADRYMQADVINKHEAILTTTTCPSSWMIVLGLALAVAGLVIAAAKRNRGEYPAARKVMAVLGGSGAAFVFLAATLFTSKHSWAGISEPIAPLIEPSRYAIIGAILVASVVCAAVAAVRKDDERPWQGEGLKLLAASAALAVVAIVIASCVPVAGNAGYLGDEYPWGKSTMMFWLLVVALFALTAFTRRGLAFAIPAAGLHITAFVLLAHGAMNGLTHPQSWWFLWPIVWNFMLLALAWVTLPNGRTVAGSAFFAQLGVSFYVYMPIVSDLLNPPMNWGYPRTWEGFKHAIMRGQYEAIGIPSFSGVGEFLGFVGLQMKHYFADVMLQFTDMLVFFALVPFAAGHWIVAKAQKKTFWQWMVAAASCFLMMSFLLILLANVKGDVQDGFIQKVKFISSHAMIAMWIGYGLVFAGALAAKYLKLPGWALMALAALMVAVSGVTPIVQNYTDDRLVFELGGAEQNGHTFGWQFGAYQLDGAKAIREQLVADEEPLPDPDWPKPMDRFSIFFGGTDPGRFVPTYMIYSADFRPDVYLITQNALADDTYMSVERDLYGDEIWIPSKEDSSAAFDRYIREAQADPVRYQTLLANGTLSLANGRVQVTGALAVMDINAILTEMMHSHDRYRHSFYVEESYVIQWMYPYLEPHGLIMKINAEKKPLDAGRIAQDRDFWDWYVRRLLDDPMYRRDFAGQKSFSKLRTSIAGLYSSGQRRRDEAQAFREAVVLYPASPEATFRYAQECLLQSWSTYDYDKVLEMMEYTDRIDPGNSRTKGLSERVKTLRTAMVDYQRYTAMRREQRTPTAEESLRFAESAVMLGRYGEARQLLQESKDRLSVPATLFAATELLIRIGDYELAESYLIDFANRYPLYGENGVIVMVQLARIQMRMGRSKDAENSLARAIRFDRKRTKALIGGDGALMKLYEVLSAPQKTPSASWASPQFGR